MSPIREQGTYMFLSAITYFWSHVYFRDNKNLFEKREIMYEKRKLRGKGGGLPGCRHAWKESVMRKKRGAFSFFRKGTAAGFTEKPGVSLFCTCCRADPPGPLTAKAYDGVHGLGKVFSKTSRIGSARCPACRDELLPVSRLACGPCGGDRSPECECAAFQKSAGMRRREGVSKHCGTRRRTPAARIWEDAHLPRKAVILAGDAQRI